MDSESKMDLDVFVRRCCVCKRTETPPIADSKLTDTFLSRQCYEDFYKYDQLMIEIGKGMKFNYKTCDELTPTSSSVQNDVFLHPKRFELEMHPTFYQVNV